MHYLFIYSYFKSLMYFFFKEKHSWFQENSKLQEFLGG